MNAPAARLHALDNLRALMMWLGIVLHVAALHMVRDAPLPWQDGKRTMAALLAWVDQKRKAVLVQRRDASGAAQGPVVDVDRQPATFSWIPRLAAAPDDDKTVLALWQEIIFSGGSHGGDMMVARSSDGGRSFSAPQNLSQSVGGDGKGRIRPDHWHNGSYELQFAPGGKAYVA